MIQKSVHRLLMTGFVAFISSLSLMAQHKVEMLPFGDMDHSSISYRRMGGLLQDLRL